MANNARQICKYQTNKCLLEFNDNLTLAEADAASNIHGRYSKIQVVGMDYSQGTGEKTIIADLNLDPKTAKYIAEEVVNGTMYLENRILTCRTQEANNFKFKLFNEQKILAHKKNGNGQSKVTILSIDYDRSKKYCWIITVENGLGIAEKQPNGGTAMKRGSYQKEKTVKAFISDYDFKKLMISLRDYIRTWETVNLNRLLKARELFEQELQAQKTA